MGKTQNKPLFRCENAVIPITEDFDLLGDTVDNKLKFDRHIAKVCRKLSQQIAALKRMKKMLPYEIRKTIYMSFIAPHFNYCAESWHFCSKTAATKLEKMTNQRAIRFVFKDKNTPYRDLLQALGLSALAEQRVYKIAGSIFRTINSRSSPSLRDLIQLRNWSHNLRLQNILNLPKVHTTKHGLKSWRYFAPKLWNSLSDSTRSSPHYKTFRKALYAVDISHHL